MAELQQETISHCIGDFTDVLDSIKNNFAHPDWGNEHQDEAAYLVLWHRHAARFFTTTLPKIGIAHRDGSYLFVRSEIEPIIRHLRDLRHLCRPNTGSVVNHRRPTQYLRYIGGVTDLTSEELQRVKLFSPLTVLLHLDEISHLLLHPKTADRPEALLLEYIALVRDTDTSRLLREIRHEIEARQGAVSRFDTMPPQAQLELCQESKDLLEELRRSGPTTFILKQILDRNVNYTTDTTIATTTARLTGPRPQPFLPQFGKLLQPIEIAGRSRSFGRRLQHSLSHRQKPHFSNRQNFNYNGVRSE